MAGRKVRLEDKSNRAARTLYWRDPIRFQRCAHGMTVGAPPHSRFPASTLNRACDLSSSQRGAFLHGAIHSETAWLTT